MGHPVRTTPQTLTREEAILALALIEEEYLELVEALFPGSSDLLDSPVGNIKDGRHAYIPDLVAVADAVADLDVVVNGCGIRHGFDLDALGKEVFESNMRKLGPDGKPIYREDGKIIKPEGWQPPNIAAVLGT